MEEFFVASPLNEFCAARLKYFDWVGGVYKFKTSAWTSPDKDLDSQVEIFLCFDFSGQALFGEKEMIQWAINISPKLGPSSVAYPGLHHRSMILYNDPKAIHEVL